MQVNQKSAEQYDAIVIGALYPNLRKNGIAVRFETKALRLLLDEYGKVEGVVARSKEGTAALYASGRISASWMTIRRSFPNSFKF